MRNPDRLDEFYDTIKEIHKTKVPDWRAGQFWLNILGEYNAKKGDPFFPEEDKLLDFIKEYFEWN